MITSQLMLNLTAEMPCREIAVGGQLYLRRYMAGTTADDYDVFVHHFLTADGDRHLHSHPRDSYSLPILGGYREEMPQGVHWRYPFTMNAGMEQMLVDFIREPCAHHFDRAGLKAFCRHITVFDWHRIAEVEPGTWSLFIVGPEILPYWYFRDGDNLEAVKSSPRDWHKSCLSRNEMAARLQALDKLTQLSAGEYRP